MPPPSPIIVIPARMESERLPGKPLAEIAEEPMIVHVWRRAMAAGCGRVVVAAADSQILSVVKSAGGEAILADEPCSSGSDRVYAALGRIDPGVKHDPVVCLQGDLPTLDPDVVRRVVERLAGGTADVVTAAAPIRDPGERDDPNVVKAVLTGAAGHERAVYFTRATAPWGEGECWHHIGLYGFRRRALERFVSLPVSALERRERLEQLRLIEAGMSIAVVCVDTVPLGVDTPADLDKARKILSSGGSL